MGVRFRATLAQMTPQEFDSARAVEAAHDIMMMMMMK